MKIRVGARAVVATAAVVAVGAAVAGAAIGDRAGVIDACYDKKGNLRLALQDGACGKQETPISWNQGVVVDPRDPPGPPVTGKVHFANVAYNGDLVSGDAVSSLWSFGNYTVTFAESVAFCAGTVSPGVTNGNGTVSPAAIPTVTMSGVNAKVEFRVPHLELTDVQTAFHLIVAC